MQATATFPRIVYVLFRHKRAMLYMFVAVMGMAVAYCLLATSYYES